MKKSTIDRRAALATLGCGTCGLRFPSTAFAQRPAPDLAKCHYAPGTPGFSLTDETLTTYFKDTVDVCLDRSSFLERGWTEQMIGRYNDGRTNERRGIFLSVFYARSKNAHPWRIDVHDWDYGLRDHINYYAQDMFQKRFWMYAYDNADAPIVAELS
jgi:hypothetical protein